jgi:anaerobic selenocysteine-containing dehydrogenase
MTARRTVRAVCPHDCPDTCAMLVTLEGDRAVRVQGDPDHDFTQGFLCHKVSRYLERVYHPDRLTTPLKRTGPKGSGRFAPISWDEALETIAGRVSAVAAGPHGPQAILPYSYGGTLGKIQSESLDRRFFHRLGASLLDRTICATAGVAGYRYTMGTTQGTDPEAFVDARYIINWGSNTAVTNMHLWVKMHEARKRGAKIVTIDPYRCRTAERSDWHIAPKVGTDAALALGMMHVLFRNGLADEAYLAEHCLGGEQLRERALQEYPPDVAARITGLPAADIERLAHEYAEITPSVIRVNYGMQRHRGGGMAVRTIACLPAVIGSWRHRGGGILLSTSALYPLNDAGLQRPDLIPPGTRTVNMNHLAEALAGELDGPPVDVLFVYNSNPAAVAPDQRRVIQGLLREDLFTVVHDQFQTDTADYADIVLPATTQLEHFDLHKSYGHHWLQVNDACIPPLGESRCNTDVFRGLARRLGFEPELFEVSDEDLAREALWENAPKRPAALDGITVDSLRSQGPQKLRIADGGTPYANGGFATPTGKCELYSERLAAIGLDPLATYIPPAESPESAPELAARFPLQMLSPPSPHFLNTTFANIDSLRKAEGTPRLYIHPDDAAPRNVRSGDRVAIRNDRGSFIATAEVGETVRSGVVVAPSIWWNKHSPDGRNCNVTTSTALTDLGGGATFFDNLVEVQRVAIEP